MMMRFVSALSDAVDVHAATAHVVRRIHEQLGGRSCDLVCLFVSPIYRTPWTEVLARVQEALKPAALIGCSGSGIIGSDQEYEWVPAMSLVAAHLPAVRRFTFSVTAEELRSSSAGGFWIDKVGAMPTDQPVFILLVDPWTCDPAKLLTELNATYPQRPMIGGLASGGNAPGEHLLFCDGEVLQEGAVGLALSGNIALETIIAQGCRPIGRPLIVTSAEEHIIWEAGGQPVLEGLRHTLSALSLDDQVLAQQTILVGVVINEMKSGFQPGDFLIRQLTGVDPQSGAIAVSEPVEVGQTIQFHLRDAAASREELRRRFAERAEGLKTARPAGALLFNCLGRGKSFYGVSHHDVRAIQTFSGKLPLGGFFCNGEIGPIGGTNFVHGYTASVGFFRPEHSQEAAS